MIRGKGLSFNRIITAINDVDIYIYIYTDKSNV